MIVRVAQLAALAQDRVASRLAAARKVTDGGAPVFEQPLPRYEMSERVSAMPHGGLAAVHALVARLGLAARIDERLHLLRVHRPYHESDHVLNIAYNALCGGRTLDEIELRRNDEVFLDALGVDAIPDPTTAGDFCRRFTEADIEGLQHAINDTRVQVWKQQPESFRQATARIDVDGSLVGTDGECKGGMALSHKGTWGYHALLVSLANTAEPLFIANRPGNRPSHEGAAAYLDLAISLCRRAGFRDHLLRGDTDFSQTQHLDRWAAEPDVRFIFGYDCRKNLKELADAEKEYATLHRRAKRAFVEEDKRRATQPRVKAAWVHEREYKNFRLRSEDVAEFEYKPLACERSYRMVVLRKNITVERGALTLFEDIRYFFYITNDRSLSAAEVVFEANDRCDQENLIAQLKGQVRALHAPSNTLLANGAYMVMAALAWSLKAWMALSLPIEDADREKHLAERRAWLRMDFRTFRKAIIDVPVQILRSGRQRIWRLLAWRPQLAVLVRLLSTF